MMKGCVRITGTAPNPFPVRTFLHIFLFPRLLESNNFVNMIYSRRAKRKGGNENITNYAMTKNIRFTFSQILL
jgi:hypothetical protein